MPDEATQNPIETTFNELNTAVDNKINTAAEKAAKAAAQEALKGATGARQPQEKPFSLWGMLFGWLMNDDKNEVASDIEAKRGMWAGIKDMLSGFAQRLGLDHYIPLLDFGDEAIDMVADVALDGKTPGGNGPKIEQVTLTQEDMSSSTRLNAKFNKAHGEQVELAANILKKYGSFIPSGGIQGVDSSSPEALVKSLRSENAQTSLLAFAKSADPGFLGVENKVQGYLAQFNALQNTIDTAQQQSQMLAQNNSGGVAPGMS